MIPREAINDYAARKKVISYGNRLFCDKSDGKLHHRWGSGRLYRAYYQDYQTFLARPELVAEATSVSDGKRIVIVHSDLRQFYDRVRPNFMKLMFEKLRQPDDDPSFFNFAESLFCWPWHRKDENEVSGYALQAEIEDLSRIALPQGLVSAGFFRKYRTPRF